MKTFIAIGMIALAAMAYASPTGDGEKYTDRWDSIDLEEIKGNRKIMENYVLCCLDRGKCTPEGKELKSKIQDALETDCIKCTDAQRKGTRDIIKHLYNKEPAWWNELKEKYDPTGKYSSKYEVQLEEVKN